MGFIFTDKYTIERKISCPYIDRLAQTIGLKSIHSVRVVRKMHIIGSKQGFVEVLLDGEL